MPHCSIKFIGRELNLTCCNYPDWSQLVLQPCWLNQSFLPPDRFAKVCRNNPDKRLAPRLPQTFAGLYPAYYEESADTFTFLLGIEEKIHELVRATISGASPPELHVQPFGEVGVLISYTSERRLCSLLEGLVLGTAEHYGEALTVEEIQCMHDGDAGCVFTVTRQEF